MKSLNRARQRAVGVLCASLAVVAGAVMAQNAEPVAPLQSYLTPDGRLTLFIELADTPASLVYSDTLRRTGVQRTALDAAAAQVQRVTGKQTQVRSALAGLHIGHRELYAVQRVLNGLVVSVRPQDLPRLRALPDVRRVEPMAPEYPTNSTSVSFIGTPSVWDGSTGPGTAADGTGVTIGVIDTGVDYQHATFGGTGLLADYQANDRAVAPDAFFPTARVVGGYDFAGDGYNGTAATIAADNDPMDCNGHGTHVAGTAAGQGVNADGTPYTGIFSPALPFASMRVGPGVAPRASVVALRVFGCGGSTNLTVQAIEWAMDPNGDADLSDHLDVINMSLGSNFGNVFSASAVAADNAAAAGVVVVTSAGNAGDTYFISGSPGSGSRVMATGGVVDSGLAANSLRVNSPAGIAGFYTAGTAAFGSAPPTAGLTGNVVLGLDPADAAGPLTTDGCSPLTNAAAVAGNIALIDRGTCGFAIKVKMAQDAGAIAAVIANSAAGAFGNMGGADPTITIPSVMVTFADANTIKANLPGVSVTLLAGGDTVYTSTSRGPRGAAGSGSYRLKPDVSAPGVSITSAQTGVTCTGVAPSTGCQLANPTGVIAGSQPLVLSGTSMAAPHMAGTVALLRQLNPSHSVEEIKALAMNYAINDVTQFPAGGARYGAGRSGAGRVDVPLSAAGDVLAMNAEDVGAVSISFDGGVLGTTSQTRKLRLVNHGTAAATYDLGIDVPVDAPGVDFSLPGGSSITIPAGASVEIDVRMDATADAMEHTRDATVAATQTAPAAPASVASLGVQNRHWLTEEAAFVTLSTGGTLRLRVPVYAATHPLSQMLATSSIATAGAPTGSTTLALGGTDVCTGTRGAGPTCTGTFPADEVSLVTPFELQVLSPPNPADAPSFADIRHAGVAYSAATNQMFFGVSMYGNWSTPTDVAVNVYIDCGVYTLVGVSFTTDTCTGAPDGVYDLVLFNTNPGTLATLFGSQNSAQDVFLTAVFGIARSSVVFGPANYLNRLSSGAVDSRVFDNNVMFLAADVARLKIGGAFNYQLRTCPGSSPLCLALNGFRYDEEVGPFRWNRTAQGLDFGGGNLFFDMNGAALPVTWNTANLTANGSRGALLLHHHNASGIASQVVPLDTATASDVAVTHAVAPALPVVGGNATLDITVTNNGTQAASGVVVYHQLPAGLTYVSDTGGGNYDPPTGQWLVGGLAAGASTTLQVVVTVDSSDEQISRVQLAVASPVDPNPSNDAAQISVNAPASADLAITAAAAAPTVLVGGAMNFTIDVTNQGPSQAYAVAISEAIPAFAALNPTSFTASVGAYDPLTGLWNIASLDSGASATLSITFTAPNFAGQLDLQASISANEADPDTANNTATASVTVLSPGDVRASKTVAGNLIVGGDATYTVVLSNSAAYDQHNNPGAEFTDVLPASLALVSASATSGTAVATVGTNTVAWDGVVPAGGSVTLTIQADIVGAGSLTVSNQGGLNLDLDGDGDNESARLTDDPAIAGLEDPTDFVIASPASVSATKQVTGDFYPGGAVRYTVVLSNAGPGAQFDNPTAEFTDPLPANLTYVTGSATSGTVTFNAGTVEWNGSIPAAGSVTILIDTTVSASATTGTTISNTGTASYDADGDFDNETPVTTDNPETVAMGDATAFVVVTPAALTASKAVAGTFRPSGAVTYTIVLHNNGPGAQGDNPGNEFTDVLPATLTLVSASASSGTAVATVGTNTVTWNGSIPVSGDVTITVQAQVPAAVVPETIVANQGSVAYDADGNGTNEATLVTDDPATGTVADPTAFTVLSPAVLSASKTVNAGTARPGGSVSYSIVLTNTGASTQFDNLGNELIDVLPAPLTLVSATAASGTATADTGSNTVSWNGSLASGASVTITVNATIDADVQPPTVVSNQASISFDADGNGLNEASALSDDPSTAAAGDATAFTVDSPAQLQATKTVSGSFRPDGVISYTVVISNSGPSTHFDYSGDEFVDQLPATLELLGATATSGTAAANLATGAVTWNGTLAAAASSTITISARVRPTVTGGTSIANQATLNFDSDGDGVHDQVALTDNPATATANDGTSLVVLSPASLAADKTVTGSGTLGQQIVYSIVLRNVGAFAQADNAGDELVDVLPASLALVSAQADVGVATVDIPSRTVRWNGALPADGEAVITIVATVVGFAPSIGNQATIHFDADGNGTNEANGVSDDPSQPGPADITVLGGAIAPLNAVIVPGPNAMMLAVLALLMLGFAAGNARLLRRRGEGVE